MSASTKSVKSQSVWSEIESRRTRPPLNGTTRAEVCVIGAGIAGLSVAYRLASEGRSVVVLDDGQIGGGQTEVTTAHLTYALDRRLQVVERIRGTKLTQLAVESHAEAINQIESNIRKANIDCQFTRIPGYLFAHTPEAVEILDREYESAQRLGCEDVVRLAQVHPLLDHIGPCLMFPNQAQFHPLKYLVGLAEAFQNLGGRIHGGTHVARIENGSPAHVVCTGNGEVVADQVVVATNTPVNDMFAIHTKQAPYLTYVVGIKMPHESVPPGLFWDTDDPFHYVRLQHAENSDHDVLIVGGEDHKTGQVNDGDERHERLEQWAREHFPRLGELEFAWAGQVMESVDGLGFIGRNPADDSNIYVATGDSGLGMTHGTIAGMLIGDLILGRENPWRDVYNPSRLPTGSLGTYARENMNVALQYTDWLTPGEVSDVRDIPFGEGAILRDGLSKVAIFRDKQGRLTKLSAVCPHLKCIVHWNTAESTWDCPCHGSRFAPEGKVLNGPANVDLPPAS